MFSQEMSRGVSTRVFFLFTVIQSTCTMCIQLHLISRNTQNNDRLIFTRKYNIDLHAFMIDITENWYKHTYWSEGVYPLLVFVVMIQNSWLSTSASTFAEHISLEDEFELILFNVKSLTYILPFLLRVRLFWY